MVQQWSDSVGFLRFEVTGSGSHADLFFQAPWWSLKKQFKGVFHNVSRVLDCVSCQKCRLHAKVGRRRMTTSHDDGGAQSRESTGASLCHVATNVLITHYSSAIGHTQYVKSASPSRALLTLTHSSPLTSRSSPITRSLQVTMLGLGAALKLLLLPPELMSTAVTRDEIVALFNTIAKSAAAADQA